MRAICAALGSLLLLSCSGGETKTAAPPSPVAPTPTYTVSGTVRDDVGAPLADARVSGGALYSKTGPFFVTQTDAAGQYRGTLPTGTFQLSVNKPGFEPFSLYQLSVSSDTIVDVTLHPGVYVLGKIREL